MRSPPNPSPDLDDLRALCAVIDLGSVTAAAKALGEAKGSVSRRVTRLEAALGVTLLERTPRLVRATAIGAAYRAKVGAGIQLLDEAHAQARDARGLAAGHLRVTAPIDLGQSLLAPVVAAFVEAHPDVTVEMLLDDAVLDFDGHQIDVAIRAGGALRDSALVVHRLDATEGRLFAAPSYLARRGAPATVAELASHTLVLARIVGGPTLSLRRGDEEAEELRATPAVRTRDFSFAKEVCVAGGGVAVLPSVIARRDVEAGSLAAVLPEHVAFRGSLYLLHRAQRYLSPAVRAFRDAVVAALRPGARARATRGDGRP